MSRRAKYPWGEWADGEEHTIEDGKDFTTVLHVMQQTLNHYAKRHDIYVKTNIGWSGTFERTITFQFYDEPYRRPQRLSNVTSEYDDPRAPHCTICNQQLATTSQPYGVCMVRETPGDYTSPLAPKHQQETE